MQIKRQSKIKKPFIILLAVILAGIVGFLTYWFVYKPQNNNLADGSSVKEITTDKQQSENIQNNPDTKTEAPNSDKPADPTASGTSSKKQVQMTASTDTSNGVVFIRGGVNYPVSGGSCYAQLSGPTGQSLRKNTTILQNPASTDCKTISIPTGELAPGKWTFTLRYTSDDYEGVTNEVSFSV